MRNTYRAIALVSIFLVAWPLSGAKHETWYEARSPNFIVVSNAGEKQARKTALEFEEIRAVFRQSIPMVGAHPSPVVTILAVKDEDSSRALLPEYWATKGHTHPGGIFYFRMNQYYAAVQLDARGDNPFELIYHEYYHSVTMPFFPNLPLWVAEGLADFYGNTEIGDKDVGIGRPDPDLIEELKQGQFIPLSMLFKVDQQSPYYNEQNKTTIFYAESWALVHYLMVGDRAAHRQMFVDYLAALSKGATQDEAAAKVFGDLKKFQGLLRQYIDNRSFYFMKSLAPAKISDADMKVREISDAESDAYRGGFMAARGRTQEAKPLLQEAIRLDPKLPLAYANLGLAEYVDHEEAKSLASVTQAITLDPKNGLTRFLRVFLSFRGTETRTDPQIGEDLRAAIAASPDYAPAYSLLAVYLAAQEDSLPEALGDAKKAIFLEPGNGSYRLSLAQVLARMEKFDEAKAAATDARVSARSPEERAQADSFLAFLKQMRDFQAQNGATSADIADPSEANSDASKGSKPSAGDSESENESAFEEVTGEVTKASCVGSGPNLELKTDSGVFHFHSPAVGGVQIMTAGRPPAGFNPCKSLNGANVTVQYKPSEGKEMGGTLLTIRILAMTGAENSGPLRPIYRPNALEGETTTAEGNVTELSCTGKEMQLSMLVGDKTIALHARDYTRMDVEEDVAFQAEDFKPCTQLKGKNAAITFVVVARKPYAGEIQRIEVGK